ncbi:MAG: hypothetical protein K6T31_06525, partial [Alicyclobacillus sp.]|nr:hypothetical protein [Alicyclobacillus sp.]
PRLIEWGLAAMDHYDLTSAAVPVMKRFVEETDESIALAIWSDQGPLFIAVQKSSKQINIGIRVGSHIPVAASATGQVLAAFRRDKEIRRLLEMECQTYGLSLAQVEQSLQEVRNRGFGFTRGGVFAGLGAVAVPVWNHAGHVEGVLTVITVEAHVSPDPQHPLIRALQTAANSLSSLLGWSLQQTEPAYPSSSSP